MSSISAFLFLFGTLFLISGIIVAEEFDAALRGPLPVNSEALLVLQEDEDEKSPLQRELRRNSNLFGRTNKKNGKGRGNVMDGGKGRGRRSKKYNNYWNSNSDWNLNWNWSDNRSKSGKSSKSGRGGYPNKYWNSNWNSNWNWTDNIRSKSGKSSKSDRGGYSKGSKHGKAGKSSKRGKVDRRRTPRPTPYPTFFEPTYYPTIFNPFTGPTSSPVPTIDDPPGRCTNSGERRCCRAKCLGLPSNNRSNQDRRFLAHQRQCVSDGVANAREYCVCLECNINDCPKCPGDNKNQRSVNLFGEDGGIE